MSQTSGGEVQITADALIHTRVHSPLARRLAIECPYDPLFLTEAGGELAQMALALDPVYEQFNLVRYAWFAGKMSDHAARYAQLVILGSGYDTRSLTLPALQAGRLPRVRGRSPGGAYGEAACSCGSRRVRCPSRVAFCAMRPERR